MKKNNTLVPNFVKIKGTCFSYSKIKKLNYVLTNKDLFFRRIFHTNVRAAHRIGPHNSDTLSVLIGSLLGNCYASAKTIEGTRFSFKQSVIHKDYLFWLHEFFYIRGYCSNLQPIMYTRKFKDKKSNSKEFNSYEFNTFTFRSFNWIQKMFYKKGKKTINFKIEKYMTPLALAVLIMDDGGWARIRARAKGDIRLSRNSFKLHEAQFLANILKKLWDLNCTLKKINTPDQYYIYINAESMLKLNKLVSPHIIPSMLY